MAEKMPNAETRVGQHKVRMAHHGRDSIGLKMGMDDRKNLLESGAQDLVSGMKKSRDLMEVKPTGTPPGQDPEAFMADALDEESVSPEEQAQYERFLLRAVQFMDGEQTQPAVLRMLNQEDLPVHVAVGRTAARIAQLVENSAKQAGQELSPDVMFHAGSEIVEMLMETGVAAQILPVDPESAEYEDVQNMAFLEGVKAFGEDLLKGPEGKALSEQASNHYAQQVAKEVDRGEVEQNFFTKTPVAEGVSQGIANGK